MKVSIEQAIKILKQGGVLAYPTETTWGLGCDALNETALLKLTTLKQRSLNKGLIVLISNYEQLQQFSAPLSSEHLQILKQKWPGPHTFICPAQPTLPKLLTGEHTGIAIRMSPHPVASALSQTLPLTSTSANLSTQATLTTADEIMSTFGSLIDGVIDEQPGGQPPSSITDLLTGVRYR